jgi:hypothetical protein
MTAGRATWQVPPLTDTAAGAASKLGQSLPSGVAVFPLGLELS